jgi:hypothetical protein
VVIDKVQTQIDKYLDIDLHFIVGGGNTSSSSGNKNDDVNSNGTNITTNSTSHQYIQAKFPKSLIKFIQNVNSAITYLNNETAQKPLQYHLDNNSLTNNVVTISLPSISNVSKIHISINGSR